MKNSVYWLIPIGLLLYAFSRKNQAQTTKNIPGSAATTTGTRGPVDPYWGGWKTKTDQYQKAITDNVKGVTDTISSVAGLWRNVSGVFGKSRGAADNPVASGSGASDYSGTGYDSDVVAADQSVEIPVSSYPSDNADNSWMNGADTLTL